MNQELSILHVEDDELDAEAVRRQMTRSGLKATISWAMDGAKALEHLKDVKEPGELNSLVVLLDLNMPRVSGHEFLIKLRSDPTISRAIVFVVTSSEHRRDIALAYAHNVAGYFHKDKVDDLIEVLKRYQVSSHFPTLGA